MGMFEGLGHLEAHLGDPAARLARTRFGKPRDEVSGFRTRRRLRTRQPAWLNVPCELLTP